MLRSVWLHMFSSNSVWVHRVPIAKALEMRRTCPGTCVYAGIYGVNMFMHERQVNTLFGRNDYVSMDLSTYVSVRM